MPRVKLISFDKLDQDQRVRAATDLNVTVAALPRLKRELPIPAEGYAKLLPTVLRLYRIGKHVKDGNLLASIIEIDGKTSGVASAQIARPKPDLLSVRHLGDRVKWELSYWHGDMGRYDNITAGLQVVSHLADTAKRDPNGKDLLWMVTLPDDPLKAYVLQELAFIKEGPPQAYDLQDEVIVPRQLWARV